MKQPTPRLKRRWQPMEKALIDRLIQRDSRAFAQLHRQYLRYVRWCVLHIVGPEQAEDTVQNVFIKAWRHIDKYDPAKAGLSTWLMLIARQTALWDVRAVATRALPGPALSLHEEEHAFIVDKEYYSLQPAMEEFTLHTAVARLPARQKQAIELIYFQGMTYEAAALHAGLPISTVKMRVRAGLVTLRKTVHPDLW